MNLLEGYLPFVVTLFTRHGHHGIERRSVPKTEFPGIGNSLRQLVIAVQEQLTRHLLAAGCQVERQTVRLRVPIGAPAVLFTRKPFGPHVEPTVAPRVGLQQLKDAEPYPLLRRLIAPNHHVTPLPLPRPLCLVGPQHRFEPLSTGPFGHRTSCPYQSARRVVQRRSHSDKLFEHDTLPGFERTNNPLGYPFPFGDIPSRDRSSHAAHPHPLRPANFKGGLFGPKRHGSPSRVQFHQLPELFVVIGIFVPYVALHKSRHRETDLPRKRSQSILHSPQFRLGHRDQPPHLCRHAHAIGQRDHKRPRQQPPSHIEFPSELLHTAGREVQPLPGHIDVHSRPEGRVQHLGKIVRIAVFPPPDPCFIGIENPSDIVSLQRFAAKILFEIGSASHSPVPYAEEAFRGFAGSAVTGIKACFHNFPGVNLQ